MKALLPILALLATACTVAPPPPRVVEPAKPSTIIVVHGLYANAAHVRPVKDRLTAAGFTCFALDIQPNDGSISIESQAEQLASYIDQNVPANAPLQLVGHSMGGLVALQYLQDRTHAARCRGLYTIATPHHGTFLANFHGGAAGREMVSNSAFLQKLNANRPPFPVTTYRSTNDIVIIPNSSSVLSFADNELISSGSHNEVLQSPQLLTDLTRRVQARDRTALQH